MHISKEYVYMV